jgi:hypothetical protein
MKSRGRFTDDLRRLMARSYDSCQSCGSKLPREIAAYAGYAADGSPLYVGECCLHLVAELATPVYWWWEVDKRCEPDAALWRYVDFAKFVALLEQRAIYFARADRLGDSFEGAAGITDRKPQWDAFYLDFFRRAVSTAPLQKEPLLKAHVEQEAARLLRDFSTIGERDRRCSFVSCWHASTGESEALWRLYCPPPMMGVAIRTTARLLIAALGDDPQIKLGRVQYVDFRKAFAGFHDRIYWKRKSLSHEAEGTRSSNASTYKTIWVSRCLSMCKIYCLRSCHLRLLRSGSPLWSRQPCDDLMLSQRLTNPSFWLSPSFKTCASGTTRVVLRQSWDDGQAHLGRSGEI